MHPGVGCLYSKLTAFKAFFGFEEHGYSYIQALYGGAATADIDTRLFVNTKCS